MVNNAPADGSQQASPDGAQPSAADDDHRGLLENSRGAPANALWLTNLCVQAMLLWTLANESTYLNLILLATSLILLPYLWSAAYRSYWRCAARHTSRAMAGPATS